MYRNVFRIKIKFLQISKSKLSTGKSLKEALGQIALAKSHIGFDDYDNY